MENISEKHKLKDGSEIEVRPLTPGDLELSRTFFQNLPKPDRHYMRVDVNDPEVVSHRLRPNPIETMLVLGAVKDGRIIGDATLSRPSHGWLSHVGEIRVITAADQRKLGVAEILFRRLFIQALKLGLEKLQIRIMPQQEVEKRCVEKLGFTREGVLPGFAIDHNGKKRDMIIMSINV